MLVSRDGREYRKAAHAAAARQLPPIVQVPSAPVSVDLLVVTPTKAGDLDNRIKPTLDALQGVIYTDDRQVTEISVRRGVDRSDPRVEVRWSEVTA